jgi:hypothetical protein
VAVGGFGSRVVEVPERAESSGLCPGIVGFVQHAPRRRLFDDSGLNAAVADVDQLRVAFGQMGQASADYFEALAAAAPRYLAFRGRQILLLRERYAISDLDAALAYGAFEHDALERILLARAKPRTLDEYVAEHAFQRLEQRLGACTTQPRDLAEYDRLPVSSSAPATDEDHERDP